jgi:glycosyltransferase involved in cell wall biosynthesis
MKPIRYSIVVTSYNQRHLIREAVDSALRQGADEIIVVDDASSDGSSEILEAYRDDIRLARMPRNGGAPRARNHGASIATGDYILFVDGDDILMPWALEVYKPLIERRKPVLMLGQSLAFSGRVPAAKLNEIGRGPIEFVEYAVPMAKDRSADLVGSALVVDRQALLSVGGWTPEIFHGDIKDLMMKLGYAGRMILILNPVTAFYRVHDRNSIHEVVPFMASGHRLIANERGGGYPGGRRHLFERYAALGAFVVFWSMKGLAAGHWKEALRLALTGLPMVLAAVAQRLAIRLTGRRPTEAIDIGAVHFQRHIAGTITPIEHVQADS